ncbi:hypothetical protein [Rufibacter latericius]|uniref:Uncharacterized protein n=1 Tax=Rufibacter latericius TaxID=2487040 RepID=A0A3M9M9Q3_9BACT|nr:hypothetical protein [Rufibacter latericius]RNI21935.1 hypothetical protein EFB08_22610 [Rufibacter latericius]
MLRLQPYIASFLLLLFCQVMVPESALLALHEHEHTEAHDEPISDGEHTVGKVHQHCKVKEYGQTYLVFMPPVEVPFFAPPISTRTSGFTFAWKFTYPNNIELRGPPHFLS